MSVCRMLTAVPASSSWSKQQHAAGPQQQQQQLLGAAAARPRTLAQPNGRRLTSCRATTPSSTHHDAQQQQQQPAASRMVASALLSSVASLSLLLAPTASAATAATLVAPPPPQQEAVSVAASSEMAQQQQQQCFGGGSGDTMAAAAPALVTDADVEAAGGGGDGLFCLDAAALEATLVNGLGWMVEEAQEASNFTESNFAAVGAPSTSMWLSNSPWCLMWDAYCNVLTSRPVATKLCTGMLGTFLGDMLAQGMQGLLGTHHSSSSGSSSSALELDLARTARLVGFSALVGTPVAFVWFSLLDQYVLPAEPTSLAAVASKVALDQVLMAPLMTCCFFAAMTALEGARSPRDVAAAVRAKLRPTLLANWTVWPLAHVINFALVPPAQRILYINAVNIAWTAFMSHMASSSSSTEGAQQPGLSRSSQTGQHQQQQPTRRNQQQPAQQHASR